MNEITVERVDLETATIIHLLCLEWAVVHPEICRCERCRWEWRQLPAGLRIQEVTR